MTYFMLLWLSTSTGVGWGIAPNEQEACREWVLMDNEPSRLECQAMDDKLPVKLTNCVNKSNPVTVLRCKVEVKAACPAPAEEFTANGVQWYVRENHSSLERPVVELKPPICRPVKCRLKQPAPEWAVEEGP